MLSRCLSVSVAISLQKIPGATSSHGGSCHRRLDGATGFSVLACLSLDPAREALLQRGRRPEEVSRPEYETLDDRPQRLLLAHPGGPARDRARW